MLPLDDMRNHEPFEMVSPVLTSGYVLRPNTNARSTPFRQHDNYLIAQRDIQKGQEIFSSYTMSSVEGNAYLLAKYGFIVPHDPHAAISWSTPLRHFFLNALTHHHGTEVVVMPRYRRPLYFMAWCRAFVASSHDFVSSSSATPSSVRKLVLTSFDFSRVASLGQEMKALSACSDVFPAETELKKQMEQIDYVQRAWGLKEERITAASSIQSKKFRFGWFQKRNILELQLMTKQYFNKRRAFLLEMCRLPTALEDNF